MQLETRNEELLLLAKVDDGISAHSQAAAIRSFRDYHRIFISSFNELQSRNYYGTTLSISKGMILWNDFKKLSSLENFWTNGSKWEQH